jgi:hypothetical protein
VSNVEKCREEVVEAAREWASEAASAEAAGLCGRHSGNQWHERAEFERALDAMIAAARAEMGNLDLMLQQGYTIRVVATKTGTRAYVDSSGTPLRGEPRGTIEAALLSLDAAVARHMAINNAEAGSAEWLELIRGREEQR